MQYEFKIIAFTNETQFSIDLATECNKYGFSLEFLDLASDNNWLLFFYHDPKTIAVKIKKSEKYYEIIEKYERR